MFTQANALVISCTTAYKNNTGIARWELWHITRFQHANNFFPPGQVQYYWKCTLRIISPSLLQPLFLKNTFILTKYNLLWKIFTLVNPYRESLICFQICTTTRVLWKLIFIWSNISTCVPVCWASLCSSDDKESACNVGDSGLIPGSGREWLPSLIFLPGQFHGQRSLVVQHFYLCAQIHDKVH